MVSTSEPYANELVRPASLEDARAQLGADPSLRPIGGGTAIVPEFRAGAAPSRWLTTTSIAGLDGVSVDGAGRLVIGAAATLHRIEMDTRVMNTWPLLTAAISAIAGPAIRNTATIGGSLALGSDSPDPSVALAALGARVQVMGDEGVDIDDLPIASGTERSALIELIRVPPPVDIVGWDYQRFSVRGASDRPFVIAAVTMAPAQARVVVGVDRPRPVRLRETGSALGHGRGWRSALDEDLSRLDLPDSDRGSGGYRSRVLRALVARAIEAATGAGHGT
jgi:CO/xanthine dehydrogenase FAD-binding subunit